jgi:hypothetical protein
MFLNWVLLLNNFRNWTYMKLLVVLSSFASVCLASGSLTGNADQSGILKKNKLQRHTISIPHGSCMRTTLAVEAVAEEFGRLVYLPVSMALENDTGDVKIFDFSPSLYRPQFSYFSGNEYAKQRTMLSFLTDRATVMKLELSPKKWEASEAPYTLTTETVPSDECSSVFGPLPREVPPNISQKYAFDLDFGDSEGEYREGIDSAKWPELTLNPGQPQWYQFSVIHDHIDFLFERPRAVHLEIYSLEGKLLRMVDPGKQLKVRFERDSQTQQGYIRVSSYGQEKVGYRVRHSYTPASGPGAIAVPPPPPPAPCPLVIDLNNDGFHLGGQTNSVLFDINADGVAERLSWFKEGRSDPFLALDLNNNGLIENGSELFGIGTSMLKARRVKASNGFEALRQYDDPAFGGNGDSTIDSRDSIWKYLLLWDDINGDGISTQDEVSSIGDDITELPLNIEVKPVSDTYSNLITLWTRIKTILGSRYLADVVFRVFQR